MNNDYWDLAKKTKEQAKEWPKWQQDYLEQKIKEKLPEKKDKE